MFVKKIVSTFFPTCRGLLIRRSIKEINLSDYKRVLVVGAGADPFRSAFPPDIKQYVCIDIDKSNKVGVYADAHSLPFKDGAFDCVIATEVLEHLQCPITFVEEVERVLDSGMLILTVPFMFHIHAHPSDYCRFTDTGLKELLKKFDSIEVKKQGGRIHVISDLLTTSFYPLKIMIIFRFINWLLIWIRLSNSTSPSGFLIMCRKRGAE